MEKRSRIINALVLIAVFTLIFVALFVPLLGALWAQTQPVRGSLTPAHLNPAIEKLAAGKPVISIQTSDISRSNARFLATSANADIVFVDMEHIPFDMEALANFALALNDKAYTLKKGNAQPKMALVAKFPPEGFEHNAWVVKQALDAGLMGVQFPGIETKEDAEFAVKSMRYDPYKEYPATAEGPRGLRGWNPVGALWVWGIGADEYRRRADVWPLNPDGDLMTIVNIESVEAINNIDEIASVPGITVLHAAFGADLSMSMGVPRDSPEVEVARQKILRACQVHKIVCAISTNDTKEDMDRRLKQGWKYIGTHEGST